MTAFDHVTASNGRPVFLRHATMDDAACILAWQSDPETRRYFRNPDVPKTDEHQAWLAGKLSRADSLLAIIMHGDEPSGIVRLDRENKSDLEVSILIAPEKHRHGIGKAALALVRQVAPLAKLSADIREQNAASQALFRSADYAPDANEGMFINNPSDSRPVAAFCPDGGKGVGLGHLTRCLALAEKIEVHGVSSHFFIGEDSGIADIVSSKGYPVTLYEPQVRNLAVSVTGATVAVIDHYGLDIDALSSILRNSRTLLCVFDDTGKDVPSANVIINGSPAAPDLAYRGESGTRFLLGPAYQIVREDVAPRADKAFRDPPERLLVTLGGDDALGLGDELFNFVQNTVCLRWPDMEVDFVFGPFSTPARKIDDLPANLTCHAAPGNFPELLREADIAISAGGQTIFELARCGVASVALTVSANQEANLGAMERAGAICTVGWAGEVGWIEKLDRALFAIVTEPEVRERLSIAAKTLVDGDGAERIADAVKMLIGNR